MISERFAEIGEYAAMGAFEEPDRSMFYRKALGIRRYYENCNLYEYEGSALYPSGVKNECMIIHPHYLKGLDVDHSKVNDETRELTEMYKNDFFKYSTYVPSEHSVAGNMYCHSIPNYGRIVREGLDAYAERIEKIEDRDVREGLLHVYEGIVCYISRCVKYLEEEKADEKLINTLKRVPLKKADNIYEAIVAWNFIMYLDNCDNLGPLAKELEYLYNGEDIVELLEQLYDNLDINNGYSMALGADYNVLTLQCLKAAKGRRPMIELFVNKDTPDEIWNAAFEVVRSGGGQPAFYNTALLDALKEKLDIRDEDINNFCGGGCTESMIAGMSNVGSLDAGINLLLIFEKVMYEHLPKVGSFEAFYNEYINNVRAVVEDVMQKICLSQKERAMYEPLPMRTLLVDDCIERGKDFNDGGARYYSSIINFAGLINVIDSMLAVNELIFKEKIYSVDDFLTHLKGNEDDIVKKCRNLSKCFGRDDDECNAFAYRLSHDIFAMTESMTPYLGGRFLPASIQFMSQVAAGKDIGATPDGRCAGSPLCDSLAAIFGKDTNGPTALLKSVASLDLKAMLGVPVLNFNVDKSWNDEVLRSLIISYMQMGGIQMQITCVSAEELRKAYEEPELHRNIVVRVGGYSEYFYRLSRELQRMVIERSIQRL